jgi:hypothetical protein
MRAWTWASKPALAGGSGVGEEWRSQTLLEVVVHWLTSTGLQQRT